MSHVMIDIETLGTEPGCVILSVGAVQFEYSPDGPDLIREFYSSIDMTSCQMAGLKIDARTLDFWMRQPEESRRAAFAHEADLEYVLRALSTFIPTNATVWARPPSFDCMILEYAYRALGLETPWRHWRTRDMRTLEDVSGVSAKGFKAAVAHHALEDAKAQVAHWRACMKALGK